MAGILGWLKARKKSFWICLGLWLSVVAGCLLAGWWRGYMAASLADQGAAGRWGGGVAQISVFFSTGQEQVFDSIQEFRHGIDKGLEEAAIGLEDGRIFAPDQPAPARTIPVQDVPEQAGAAQSGRRLWLDAYSGRGSISLQGPKGKLEGPAIGVGGDFFYFHPQNLIYGQHFSDADWNRDYILLDREAAWQLFGALDVAGQMVYAGPYPLVVAGVFKKPEGALARAAGLDAPLIFLSASKLEEAGSFSGVNQYELLLPNPVPGWAKKYVQEKLKVEEQARMVVENSGRFDIWRLLPLLGSPGLRSMSQKAILYPYWENLARAYEDRAAGLVLLQLVLAVAGLLPPLALGVRAYRRRSWRWRAVAVKWAAKVSDTFAAILAGKKGIGQMGFRQKGGEK